MATPPPTTQLFIFDYILPIFAGSEVMKPTVVAGTAFGLGDNCFMTAAHCLREGQAQGWMALGTTNGKAIQVWNIPQWELVEEYDVAVFRAEVSVPLRCFAWTSDELPMTTAVKSVGYAHAMDPGRDRMRVRSFTGNIVSATTLGRLPSDPPCYELSFACPRGLSGAPVLERRGELAVVAGMVIGNERMEMNVLTEREVVSEGEKTIFERYEALNLGIALQSRCILGLGPFKVLNGRRIREHLAANSLFGG
jgi:hypothetical protein